VLTTKENQSAALLLANFEGIVREQCESQGTSNYDIVLMVLILHFDLFFIL